MRRMLPVFIAVSFSMASPLQAETLEMPAATEAPGYSVNLPGRGMTMEQVEEKFGPPMEKLPEVGDPPIIRWIYPSYTVYFEYQYVINSVLNVPTAPAPQPMPSEPMAPAEMPPRSENPVDISPGVEIIPPPEGSGEIIQAPEPSDNIEAPPEVNEPEAEVVVPETPPE
jgi:hypothetical protein